MSKITGILENSRSFAMAVMPSMPGIMISISASCTGSVFATRSASSPL